MLMHIHLAVTAAGPGLVSRRLVCLVDWPPDRPLRPGGETVCMYVYTICVYT